jgi:hypothetical protein
MQTCLWCDTSAEQIGEICNVCGLEQRIPVPPLPAVYSDAPERWRNAARLALAAGCLGAATWYAAPHLARIDMAQVRDFIELCLTPGAAAPTSSASSPPLARRSSTSARSSNPGVTRQDGSLRPATPTPPPPTGLPPGITSSLPGFQHGAPVSPAVGPAAGSSGFPGAGSPLASGQPTTSQPLTSQPPSQPWRSQAPGASAQRQALPPQSTLPAPTVIQPWGTPSSVEQRRTERVPSPFGTPRQEPWPNTGGARPGSEPDSLPPPHEPVASGRRY